MSRSIAAAKNRAFIRRRVEVLVEGPAKRPAGWLIGRTPHFKSTVLPPVAPVGSLVTVEVADATAHTLIATAEDATILGACPG